MAEINFFTKKSGEKSELCKSCFTMHMNMYEEDTFLWGLQEMDVPYIPQEWKKTREKEFDKALIKAQTSGAKDPRAAAYNMTKGNPVVFGKYLSKMKINQWKKYTWADTEKINQQEQEDEENLGCGNETITKKIQEIKEAYERGEISEAQYMTYVGKSEPPPKVETEEDKFLKSEHAEEEARQAAIDNNPYPVNEHPFEEVDLPDVSVDLTVEDKRYLAIKWGRLYTPEDWVSLEATYKEYESSFDIHNSDLERGLIQLCKLDLKLNQAMDSGDYDSYAKLYRSYDALRKSLKFTEAQNKEQKSGDFDSIGSLVAFAEKKGGAIPEWTIDAPKDVIDTIIEDNQRYLKTLWEKDPHLSQLIEDFMEKVENQKQHKLDLEKAKEQGLDEVILNDEDYTTYLDHIEEQTREDLKGYQFTEEEDEE